MAVFIIWEALEYILQLITPFKNNETSGCCPTRYHLSLCVRNGRPHGVNSVVLLPCFKLLKQQLQNVTYRGWKWINTPLKTPAIPLSPGIGVCGLSRHLPWLCDDANKSVWIPSAWQDFLRQARWQVGGDLPLPLDGFGPRGWSWYPEWEGGGFKGLSDSWATEGTKSDWATLGLSGML